MVLFPSVIPVQGNIHTDAEYVQKKRDEEKVPSSVGEWLKDITDVAKRLFKNRIYVLHLLATNFIIIGIVGFATFLPKYFEFVFRIRASTSVIGPAAKSAAGVIGLLLAGAVVTKWQPRARKLFTMVLHAHIQSFLIHFA